MPVPQVIAVSVLSHAIHLSPNNGNIAANANQANQIVDFESDNPFAIFFKASARIPAKRPRRPYNIAITVNPPSPDDSGEAVLASKFHQGIWRVKMKFKPNLQAGMIYWYGVAAFDPPFGIVTVDPQIIIN